MGYHAKISADPEGLTEQDAAQLVDAGLLRELAPGAPISGCVLRDGRLIRYTLDPTAQAPAMPRVVPEQVMMAALLLASFAAPLWHLLR